MDSTPLRMRVNDTDEIAIPRWFVRHSPLLRGFAPPAEGGDRGDLPALEVNTFTPRAWELLLNLARAHADDPPLDDDMAVAPIQPGRGVAGNGGTPADDDFLKAVLEEDAGLLFTMLLVADKLDHRLMTALLVTMLAVTAEECDVATLRRVFNVPDDMSPEAQEVLMRQFGWFGADGALGAPADIAGPR